MPDRTVSRCSSLPSTGIRNTKGLLEMGRPFVFFGCQSAVSGYTVVSLTPSEPPVLTRSARICAFASVSAGLVSGAPLRVATAQAPVAPCEPPTAPWAAQVGSLAYSRTVGVSPGAEVYDSVYVVREATICRHAAVIYSQTLFGDSAEPPKRILVLRGGRNRYVVVDVDEKLLLERVARGVHYGVLLIVLFDDAWTPLEIIYS